jgi:hypothetical protein
MRIAILGAGNTGTCAALELARRGHRVELYDEAAAPVSRASFHNEGKVHLGILYAKDPSLRTAALMIRGALMFAPLLDRWVGWNRDRVMLSMPFYYGVHAGTMVDPAGLKAHYARCREIFDAQRAAQGPDASYLGVDRSMAVDELSRAETDAMVTPEYFVTMFRTTERAVDPRTVARLLRSAALEHPRIAFVGEARVTSVAPLDGSGLRVAFRKDGGIHEERYDQVANTLWHGRLEIDATMGLQPDHPWMYRYKFANRILVPLAPDDVPSITCVLGPFGDIVNYGANGLFLSWYPEGMIGTSHALRPPEWDRELTPERRQEVFRRSVAEWVKRCPALRALSFRERDVDPGGGVIFAWGDTDVDDHGSKLHERHELGVYSSGGYHTVNTGKYTMTPYMGLKTAERILGLS